MYVITGGAGFIGSNIAAALADSGADIVISDWIGPNEYHKVGQRSVAVQLHAQIRERGQARLFRSENPDYSDGGQLRDFVWVGDCVRIALWATRASLNKLRAAGFTASMTMCSGVQKSAT